MAELESLTNRSLLSARELAGVFEIDPVLPQPLVSTGEIVVTRIDRAVNSKAGALRRN
jgi:hypothetical protein